MNNPELGFRHRLTKRQKLTGSPLCVGLDPVLGKMPDVVDRSSDAQNVTEWMKNIIDATAPYTSMYKPNSAFWESFDNGLRALKNVISYTRNKYPDIVIFDDAKRGDIDNTQAQYGKAIFDIIKADGMNYSPYMGESCLKGLIDPKHPEKALVSLCYTSNESARKVQDKLTLDNEPYWEFIAKEVLEWSERLGVVENAGLVMAAAYENPKGSGQVFSDHLKRCRELIGDKLWFLIPGIGTQGGFVAETLRKSWTGYGSIAVNSSSGIIFASQGDDYAEAAAQKAKELHLEMKQVIEVLEGSRFFES